ncbi:helix-turn-helix transcriptional regulator [Lacunimicrobium album]
MDKSSTIEPVLLSKQQAASRLGISVRTLDQWRQDGRIQAIKLSATMTRFHVGDLDQIIEQCRESKGQTGNQ